MSSITVEHDPTDPIYAHLDYELHPDIRLEGCPLAGEGFWCQPRPDGLYVVDNLLTTTMQLGLRDVVRIGNQGTAWGDREFVEVVESHPCFRFLVATEGEDGVVALNKQIRERWAKEDVPAEGGYGLLSVQTTPDGATAFLDFIEATGLPFLGEPSPALVASWEGADA